MKKGMGFLAALLLTAALAAGQMCIRDRDHRDAEQQHPRENVVEKAVRIGAVLGLAVAGQQQLILEKSALAAHADRRIDTVNARAEQQCCHQQIKQAEFQPEKRKTIEHTRSSLFGKL